MTEIILTVEETDNTMLCRYGLDLVAEAAYLPGSGNLVFRYSDSSTPILCDSEREFLKLVLSAFNVPKQLDDVYADYRAQKAAQAELHRGGEPVEEHDLYNLTITVEDYEVAA